tara:strand:+ start:18 stop:509 length:492 start_codon:yes stop_codon:yes gene_type:complete
MSLVALTNFITITTSAGGNPSDLKPSTFQNGKYDQPIEGYEYLSFIYQGAARNRSGDNMEAALILANNEISMGYAKKAVDSRYHIKIDTFLMTTDFNKKLDADNEARLLTSETWLAASLTYDPSTIEILLSSAIDAVGANAPNRVLTTLQVGALPITGTIQNR